MIYNKQKIATIAVLLTSCLGYLEWGTQENAWVLVTEVNVFSELFTNPGKVLHPFTVIPITGQLLLLTSIQYSHLKWLVYLGVACIGLLYVFMAIIGCLKPSLLILASTLPYLLSASWLSYLTLKRVK